MVNKNKITFIAEAAQGHEGKLSNIKICTYFQENRS